MQFWPVVLLAGIIAVLFAAWLARDVLSQDRGTKAMQEVAGLIFEGAMAFLNRQYRTIAVFALVAAVIIGVLIGGLATLSLPGLAPFVSEFLVLIGTFTRYPVAAIAAATALVLSAVYVLWMYQRMMTGPVKDGNDRLHDLAPR